MGGLAQRKESSLRSLNYPPSMHLSFTFNNHFPFFVVVAVVVVVVVFFFSFLPFFFLYGRLYMLVRAAGAFFLHLVVTRIEVTYNRFMS